MEKKETTRAPRILYDVNLPHRVKPEEKMVRMVVW